MDGSVFLTLIVLFIFLVFVVLILVWVYVIKHPPNVPPPSQYTKAGYGMRCIPGEVPPVEGDTPSTYIPQPCDTGLTCVMSSNGETGFCKRSIGATCTALIECVPEATYCTGVCSTSAIGGLNQNCEGGACNTPDLVCVDSKCKLVDGATGCVSSSDCSNGSCQTNPGGIRQCVPQYPNGWPCVTAADCQSGCCDLTAGYCQAVSTSLNLALSDGSEGSEGGRCVVTGSEGSACKYYGQSAPSCFTGLICFSNFDSLGGPVGDAVCGIPQDVWPSRVACSNTSACLSPLLCQDFKCVLPSTSGYPDVLSCVQSGLCFDGFSCTDGKCIGDGATTPYPSAVNRWGILKWTPYAQTSHGQTGVWSQVTYYITAPISSIPINSSIFTAYEGTRNLFLYRTHVDTFYLYREGDDRTYAINFTPSQSTATFQRATLTPGGNLMIQYYFISTGIFYARVSIQPIPSSWLSTSTPATSITYLTSVPITFKVNTGTSTSTIPNITYIDVDDRVDQDGKARILVIDSSLNLYVTTGTVAEISLIDVGTSTLPSFTLSRTGVTWAQFYSASRIYSYDNAYIFSTSTNYYQVSDWRGSVTSLGNQVDYPTTLLSTSLYSPYGGGIDSVGMLYFVQNNTPSGDRYSLGLRYRGVDTLLPGLFRDQTAVAVTQSNSSAYSTDTSFYLLCRI